MCLALVLAFALAPASDEGPLNNDPWFDPVRTDARFVDALAKAEAGRRESAQAYEEAGGIFLLGPGLR